MRLSKVCLLLFIASFALSCNRNRVENLVSGYDPIIKNATFVISRNGRVWATAPMDKPTTNETPPRYIVRTGFPNEQLDVGCQYVGRAEVNLTSKADVYLISVKIGDQPEENVPVVYSGGNKVVVDRPEVQISFRQDEQIVKSR
jgi:hypothetical protein